MKLFAYSILTFCALSVFAAKEEILYKSDFDKAKDLSGWIDVYQKNPPTANLYSLEQRNGGRFLIMPQKAQFGLSRLLSKPVTCNDKLDEICLEVTFIHPSAVKGRQARIALTSRESTARDSGGPFWQGKEDSGILACGYSYSIQAANFLTFLLEGNEIRSTAPNAPFNFFPANDKLTTWKLTYSHKNGKITLTDGSGKILAELYGHRLDGATIRSLWLGGFGTEYKSVKVTAKFL